MKTNRIILVIVFCLVVLIAVILMKQASPNVTSPSNVGADIASNSVPAITNHIQVTEANGKTNAAGDEDYFKKIVDSETGKYAIIGLDQQTVTLKDKGGNVIWTVNLINDIKKTGLPAGWRITDGFFSPPTGGKPQFLVVADETASFHLDVGSGKVTDSVEIHRIP